MGIEQMHLEPERGYGPRETHRYLPGGQRPAPRNTGNWLASSGDLARFAVAVAGSGGGQTFLRPKTMELMLECPPSLIASGKAKRRGPHVGLGWDTAEVFPNGTYRFSKNGGKPGVEAWLEHLETGIDWALFFNTGRTKEGLSPLGEAQSDVWRNSGGNLGPGLSRRNFDCRRSLASVRIRFSGRRRRVRRRRAAARWLLRIRASGRRA